MDELLNLKFASSNYGDKIAVLREFNFGKNWARVDLYDYVGVAKGFSYIGDYIYLYKFDKTDEMTLEKFYMGDGTVVGVTEQELQKDIEDED